MRGIRSLFVLPSVLGSIVRGAVDDGLSRRGVDNPTPENFRRHAFPAAVVIGDYVYIDGGEMSQAEGGQEPSESKPSYAMNSTLSLPIKSSWTNDSVSIRSITKKAPLQNQQIYWNDPAVNSFYTWGGMTANWGEAADNEIWKFLADGEGGGEWSKVTLSTIVAFSNSLRPIGAAFTTHNGVGYALGGDVSIRTDTSISGNLTTAIPGYVTFDMRNLTFTNSSSDGFEKYGTNMNGRAEFIPFGPDGLLIFLGGSEAPVGGVTEYDQLDWNSLSMLDPKTNKWYSQKTTGSKPTTRERHCTVGVAGPNGTYEIFIYGGMSDQTTSSSDEVFVLSLPGFVFFKSSSLGTPRNDHACVVVGKRQMLSVGGTNGYEGYPNSILQADPWKQGLGIFDMSQMQWASSYDANAAEYESPQVIRDWYDQGGLASVSWGSDDVKALFIDGSNPNVGDNGTSSTTSSSSGPYSSSTGTGDEPQTSSTPVGAIVGGAVGGVALLAAIGGAAGFLLRRRMAQKAALVGGLSADQQWQTDKLNSPTWQYPLVEMPTEASHGELATQQPRYELAAHDALFQQNLQEHYAPEQSYTGTTDQSLQGRDQETTSDVGF